MVLYYIFYIFYLVQNYITLVLFYKKTISQFFFTEISFSSRPEFFFFFCKNIPLQKPLLQSFCRRCVLDTTFILYQQRRLRIKPILAHIGHWRGDVLKRLNGTRVIIIRIFVFSF